MNSFAQLRTASERKPLRRLSSLLNVSISPHLTSRHKDHTNQSECLFTVAPEVRENQKAAVDVGMDARLRCISDGAPEITFTWSRVKKLTPFICIHC